MPLLLFHHQRKEPTMKLKTRLKNLRNKLRNNLQNSLKHKDYGFSDYISFMIVLPLLLIVIVGGSYIGQSIRVMSTLNHALQIVGDNITQNGALTSNGQNQLIDYVQKSGLSTSNIYLNATTTPQSYGSRGLQATIGYDFNLKAPGSTGVIWHKYYEQSLPIAQSQLIPGSGADTSGTVSISSVFTGIQGGTGSGGSGSGTGGVSQATSMTMQASTTSPIVNTPVSITGKVYFDTNTAPAGTQVAINGGGVSQTVSTDSTGSYTASVTFTQTGAIQLQATSGAATASVSLSVQANTPATIQLQVPTSVRVGSPFTVSGTVFDNAGNVVIDGTAVTITSSDTKDITATSVTTQSGNFSYTVNNGVTSLQAFTITASAGPASATQNIAVIPGQPQSLSLNLSSTNIVAGSKMTFSGQVLGPDGTPPAQGTQVTIISGTDNVDALPVVTTDANGNYTASAILTLAGNQVFNAQTVGPIVSASATTTVTAGNANKVNGITGTPNPVNAGANIAISGYVVDQYGNPVTSGTVLQIGSSALASPVSTSVLSGMFNAKITFQTPGIQTLKVEDATGNPLIGGSLNVDVLATAAYTLTPSQGLYTVAAGQSISNVVFTLKDSNGQPVAGKTIQFSETPQGNTLLTPASAVTDVNGQVQTTVGPFTSAGTQTLTATLADVSNVVGTVGITVSPGSPSHVVASVSPSTTQVWTSQNPVPLPVVTGTVTDMYGNAINGGSITLSGGYGNNVSGTTNSNGGFSLSITPTNIGGPYPIKATVNGIVFSGVANIIVSQYPPTSLKMWALNGTSVYTGQLYPIVAELYDQGLNPLNGQSITFSVLTDPTATVMNLTPSGPGGSGTGTLAQTTGTYTSGQAGVNVIFDQPGTQSIEVKYNDTVQILTVNVYPSNVAQIAWNPIQPGTTVSAGTTLTASGVALNSLGQGVPDGTKIIISMPGTSTASVTAYTTTKSGQTGYFTAQLKPTTIGSFYIQANANNQTFQYGAPIVISPGTVTSIGIWGGPWYPGANGQIATGTGTVFGISVLDQYGNVVPGVQVNVTMTASNGGVLPSPIYQPGPTNPNGQTGAYEGPFYYQGTYTATVSYGSISASGTFKVVNNAPGPYSITNITYTVNGTKYSPSSNPINVTAGTPITVSGKIVDQFNNPNQAVVNLSFDSSSNGLVQVESDSSGYFTGTVTPYTTGSEVLGALLNTTLSGGTSSVYQNVNVTLNSPANVSVFLNPSTIGINNAPEPMAGVFNVIVFVTDAYNNPVSSATASISTSTTDPNVETGLPTTINITNGIGEAKNLSIIRPGSWPINVTVGNLTKTIYLAVN